jgi:hypothetical protein
MGDVGKDLFRLSAESDLSHVSPTLFFKLNRLTGQVMDPSPRISILQALADTSSFTSHLPIPNSQANEVDQVHANASGHVSSPSTPKKRKSRQIETETRVEKPIQTYSKGDLGDLEILYNLWKGAGKQVNLWDWLQGYKNHVTGAGEGDDEGEDGIDGADDQELGMGTVKETEGGRKRKHADEDLEVDEDRLHATFVRFCEEARMLGMVRARGKAVGRKADEVVKGVTLL